MKTMINFLIICMFLSCQRQNHRLSKEVAIQNYIDANFMSYKKVYDEIDSIISNNSKIRVSWYAEKIILGYEVDRLIVFNKEKNKLFTTLNTSSKKYLNASSDLIQSLYGVKIGGKWHVYLGANLIAMRDGYKTNKYEPFTWEELSYVAHEQMFGRFIGFDENGNMLSKHDMVEKFVNPWDIGGTEITHEGTEEERFLRLTAYNQSKKLDSTEYQQLLNEINNPEPKEREPIKKLTWWDKLWGAEVPVFDSKEWKEYIANKKQKK